MNFLYENKFRAQVALTFLAVSGLIFILSTPVLAHDHGAHAQHENVPSASEVPIGGDFTLTDQHGKTVKESDFRGKLMLVFFGFTHCPDICPVTVSTLSKLMPLLGDDAGKVAPIFITVDPARDTPARLKDYLSSFDKRIIALTGDRKSIKQAADAYKVYFSEAPPQAKADENYQVDHSTIVYLMDTNGKYVKHFPYNATEQEFAAGIREALK